MKGIIMLIFIGALLTVFYYFGRESSSKGVEGGIQIAKILGHDPNNPFIFEKENNDKSEELTRAKIDRERRVLDSLRKFLEQTKNVSEEHLKHERQMIKTQLANLQQKKTEIPRESSFSDEHGDKWQKLQFSNGIVRYIPDLRDDKE